MGTYTTLDGKSLQTAQFSIQSDVVSRDPSNTFAGVGGVSVTTPLYTSGLDDTWDMLYGKELHISSDSQEFNAGVLTADVNDLLTLSVTGESPLKVLQGTATVPPFTGTMRQALNHFFSPFNSPVVLSMSDDVGNITDVVIPAYYGEVWPFFRDFLSANKLESVITGRNAVTIRKWDSVGGKPIMGGNFIQPSTINESVSGEGMSEKVSVKYFSNEYVTNGTVYPVVNEDPSVISVNHGDIAVIDLRTSTGMLSVNQPVAVDFLGKDYTGEGSVGAYTIAGSDGNRVSAAGWMNNGGRVEAQIKEDDPYTVILTITSPIVSDLPTVDNKITAAPYSLAMQDNREMYPRLFLTGTGVKVEENEIEIHTGASGDAVELGVGFTLDNRHVDSLSKAYDSGIRLAQAYSSPRKTISRSVPDLGGRVFTDSQGSILNGERANYRVISSSLTETGVSESAEPHTTFSDSDSRWSGKKFSDFNSWWSGYTFQEHAISPLR